ncbi:MAG: prolipoprotein diacylglyceryl transferase family protein [Candidatus Peribacteraceae bacterium]
MFEAFEVGPMIIWFRVVFLLLAIWLAIEFFMRLAHAAGLSLQGIRDAARWHFLAFILGGRLLAVIAEYQPFLQNPLRIFILWDGAFSFLGGAVGVATVLFFTTRAQRTTFLQWLDVLLPATTFGLALDWFGKFMSAQAYGKPTNVFWGVTFDTFSVRYTVPIHPVQLYYALFFLVLTFLLLLIRKHSKRSGSETLIGIVIATLGVFFLEFLRGDFGIPVFAMLTDFFFMALLFVSLGVLALIEHRLTPRVNTIYSSLIMILTVAYVILRPWIGVVQYQLRFSQVLAILALLGIVVYVTVHRRKHPHL